MPKSIKSLSIFFPCYNEERNIVPLIQETEKAMKGLAVDYEIIIVDDGSSDKTGTIADTLAQQNPKVKVVHHHKNLGYGAALRSGFQHASKELIFYTDGDRQFKIQEIKKLLPFIDKHSIVTGFRIKRQDNFIRKLNGRLWTWLVNILFKLKVKDIDCAFKLYRREVFSNIELKSNGAFIDTETLVKAHKRGYSIFEVGVKHFPRKFGKQSGANPKVIVKAFYELFKLWKEVQAS